MIHAKKTYSDSGQKKKYKRINQKENGITRNKTMQNTWTVNDKELRQARLVAAYEAYQKYQESCYLERVYSYDRKKSLQRIIPILLELLHSDISKPQSQEELDSYLEKRQALLWQLTGSSIKHQRLRTIIKCLDTDDSYLRDGVPSYQPGDVVEIDDELTIPNTNFLDIFNINELLNWATE